MGYYAIIIYTLGFRMQKYKIIMEEKSGRGGKREGSGLKKTTAKRIGFNAPQDVADILSLVEGNITDFICDAIREKVAREKQSTSE